jgi:hypothetical protein
VTRNKVATVTMFWDATFRSWDALGVPGQPAWALLAADGSVIEARTGGIPYDRILTGIG